MPAGHPILRPGAELDGFEIGPLLHKGGMAMLYEARRPGLSQPLILKTPRLGEGEDPAAIVSFEMEMMILPRLEGPHAPRVFGVGDFARDPYIVLERLPGPSLLAKLASLPLPVEEVARIGAAVADGLNALHRQNVIHLDVKPSNILFRDSGEAVLIDYGLAHHAELPDLLAEEFRLPYGTAPYIAPEQTLGQRGYRRSDLFALGVLLYFFATGVRPFGDPEGLKGLRRRLWEDPVPPRALRPELPDWLQEIILHCLEPDPEARLPTAAALAFDLRHPEQTPRTARAAKLKRDGWLARSRRRRAAEAMAGCKRKQALASQIAATPILCAAVDLSAESAALAGAMHQTLQTALAARPGARLACLNVLKLKTVGLDATLDAEGRNRHVQRLVELQHWAAPLRLPEARVSFHVLEAADPAAAILGYAHANHVDHIVMGARAESLGRRLLGSVSAEVAAHAPCTVTVVRARALAGAAQAPRDEAAA